MIWKQVNGKQKITMIKNRLNWQNKKSSWQEIGSSSRQDETSLNKQQQNNRQQWRLDIEICINWIFR